MSFERRNRTTSGASRRSRSLSRAFGELSLSSDYSGAAYDTANTTGYTRYAADDLAFRPRSSSRRPGSYTGRSRHADLTFETSPVDRTTRSRSGGSGSNHGSYYPPSASRDWNRERRRSSASQSGELAIFDLEYDEGEQPRAGPSRPRRQTLSSSGSSWEPARPTTTGRARDALTSAFWSEDSPEFLSPENAISAGKRPYGSPRSHSSGEGVTFGRSSGEDGSGYSPEITASPIFTSGKGRVGYPQIYATSYKSGFSDDMEIDENGQERFRAGSKLDNEHSAYHAWQEDSHDAEGNYRHRIAGLPRRPREDVRAGIGGYRMDLRGNFTVDEHRDLRRRVNDAFRAKREETLGREAFNRDYHRVWVKRSKQTGRDSVAAHEDAASDARTHANKLYSESEAHAHYLDLFGDDDYTPLSSWEGRATPRRRRS